MAPRRKSKRKCCPAVPTLQSLPSDLVCRIALHLDLVQRLFCLGLVCKQMNQIVRESSILWHDLKFNRPDAFDPRNKLRHAVQRLAFVRRHINVIRSVDVGSYIGDATPTLATVLAVLAGAPALRRLCMLAETDPETFTHCGQLHQLTALEVGPVTGAFHPEQFDDCLWGMTHLQSLRLRFDLEWYAGEGPHKFPPVLLRLAALTHLSFGTQRPAGDAARAQYFVFGDLPAELFQRLCRLQFLQLFNCTVTSCPAEISLLTGLQTLSILSSTALPQPQLLLPAEISACTALTSLQLSCAAVPPHIWRLPLRDLTLDQTWMTAADMQQFSSLAALRSLQLCNKQDAQPERDYFSALHSLAVGPQLTCLRLDGNSLIATSPISAITQLVELDVRRNRLTDSYFMLLAFATRLSKLDLSYNDQLSLHNPRDASTDESLAMTLAGLPALRIVGLRRDFTRSWNAYDMQLVNGLHRACAGDGQQAPNMIFRTSEVGDRPEDVNEIDRETFFLDQIVNSFIE